MMSIRNRYCQNRRSIRRVFMSWICVLLMGSFTSSAVGGDISGTVKSSRKKYRENTVIYIDKIPGKEFASPEKPAIMDQKNMKFSPHVLPLLKGTTVDFLNSDALKHNVFTPDKVADKFNLGTWPQGQKRSFTFQKPGVAVMLCKVHPEMEAWIVIIETPYMAVCDKEGSFTIKDVPPGDYTLKVWNKKLKSSDVKITVPEKGEVTTEITLKR